MSENILDTMKPTPEDVPANAPPFILPAYPDSLLELPGALGAVQDFIFNRMTYPSRALAGFATFATLTPFAQTNVTIKSRDGLGFNEYYMILAPTGFGKEDLRRPIELLDRLSNELHAENGTGNLAGAVKPASPAILHAAPSSAQGAHQQLEQNRSAIWLADELAEWLKHSHRPGSHVQMALGYFMQAYTRATGWIHPGHAVTNQYEPVENPRVSIMATSTAEAALSTMTRDQADAGSYNRFLIFPGDQELPPKRYEGLVYEPSQDVVELVLHLKTQPPGTQIAFSKDGWQAFKRLDELMAEPIKRRDALLGGRLSEQAIKMAALIALAHDRRQMEPQDLMTAFDIRCGIYERAFALAAHEGSLDGLHETGEAAKQVEALFRRKAGMHRSTAIKDSKKMQKLPVHLQKAVLDYLFDNGVCEPDEMKPAYLHSLIYQEGHQ